MQKCLHAVEVWETNQNFPDSEMKGYSIPSSDLLQHNFTYYILDEAMKSQYKQKSLTSHVFSFDANTETLCASGGVQRQYTLMAWS